MGSFSYMRGRYNNTRNSLNLNYNKRKVSLFANVTAGAYGAFGEMNINRYYKDENDIRLSSFTQNSYTTLKGKYINSKLGLDYYITDATAIGLSYKNVSSPGERGVVSEAGVSDSENLLLQKVQADNLTNSTRTSGLVNFYVNHALDTLGSKISFDADYIKYNFYNDQVFLNSNYNKGGLLTYEDRINGENPSIIEIYGAKTDYTKPFSDGSRLEVGLKTARTQTDNEVAFTNTIDNVTMTNYKLSNRFLYDERINSGYVNYNRSIGPIEIQTGLRLETTKIMGDQLGNIEVPDSSFTRSYTSLFPTFYASSKLDSSGAHTLSFSYGRRIDRPYFQQLNPFISPIDQFTFYAGNPNLLPTFAHNLSLTHSYKGIVNTSLSYTKSIDDISETFEIRDRIYYSRPGNIASTDYYTLSVDANREFAPWYGFNIYLELGHLNYKSQVYTEQLDSGGTYFHFSANNTFQLGKGWKAQIGGNYWSGYPTPQSFFISYGQIDLGFQKKILNGKGNLRLSVRDLLYTQRGNGVFNDLRLTDADWNSKSDTRRVSLTFSLRFGKSLSKKQKYNSSGSDSEQRRVQG